MANSFVWRRNTQEAVKDLIAGSPTELEESFYKNLELRP
jgi:hypothetical protein